MAIRVQFCKKNSCKIYSFNVHESKIHWLKKSVTFHTSPVLHTATSLEFRKKNIRFEKARMMILGDTQTTM